MDFKMKKKTQKTHKTKPGNRAQLKEKPKSDKQIHMKLNVMWLCFYSQEQYKNLYYT